MRVLRLARARWEVLAICDGDGRCPVLDLLQEGYREGSKEARDKMLSLLIDSVPFEGPQLRNPTVCKPLRPLADGLFEFRKQPKRGAKPRVIWFFDGERCIVCTVGFFKRDQVPETQLEQARAMKAAYFEAKAQRRLSIINPGEVKP
ncbi:MAG TPA: type II toxin-antitoxin system RelE/ParE family toxin [Thermoanaerobaculia bacterium]|jgi:hypothetical protein|nr:type II toxin-antitoxin system RelE/ParE family toxin [Thermoanaerobaculia bacterium]